jgi:uncharacterized protein with FMN-binding domain
VQIRVNKGRLRDVQALELPNDNAHSRELSELSGPLLRDQALSAQSWRIHGVTGATQTSISYRASLQNALDVLHGTPGSVGETAVTPYGHVQVGVTIENGRIVSVVALTLPRSSPQAQATSERIAPILREQALTAQNAHITGVSGASATSRAYAVSLQSALDRAHFVPAFDSQ